MEVCGVIIVKLRNKRREVSAVPGNLDAFCVFIPYIHVLYVYSIYLSIYIQFILMSETFLTLCILGTFTFDSIVLNSEENVYMLDLFLFLSD